MAPAPIGPGNSTPIGPGGPPLNIHHHTPQHHAMPPHHAPPNVAPHHGPPGGPVGANVYNAPRAPEVYTLADNVDAAIPKEVREQFQQDEQGRVLFFTAPPLSRPTAGSGTPGVSEQYAGLGHSVSHLATIRQLREERARKRKERDEAIAREKRAQEQKEREERNRKRAKGDGDGNSDLERKKVEAYEQFILTWSKMMNEETKALLGELGGQEAWDSMMRKCREENKGLSERELREKNLRWLWDERVKKGEMTEAQRQDMEKVFIASKAT